MRIVVALGGNALGKTPEEQLELVKETAKHIVEIVEEGHEVIIVHGNGPQVGMINLAFDNAYQNNAGTPLMPFAECGAMSQGYIGYHLQQAISDELNKHGIDKKCETVVTRVLVNKNDKAFLNPTKPVGMFYDKKQASKIKKEKGYTFVEDAGRGYRRVVPSPKPVSILELDDITNLVNNGSIVIACGGGGIPVVKEGKEYKGVDAVIDKDFAACKLALSVDADALIILTAVNKVCIKYNTPEQKELDEITLEDAKKYIKKNEFAKGSMLPKIEACMNFVENSNNGEAIIAALADGVDAINGITGTKIVKGTNNVPIRKKRHISTTLMLILSLFVIGILSYILPEAQFVGGKIVDGSGVVRVKKIFMSPITGFNNSASICCFLIILGAFVNIIKKCGIFNYISNIFSKKFKNKEFVLISLLMIIFSIVGYFSGLNLSILLVLPIVTYILVTMGFDTLTSLGTVILGFCSGNIGYMVNDYVVNNNLDINTSVINTLVIILSIFFLILSIMFVCGYSKKIKKSNKNSVLSLSDKSRMDKYILEDRKISLVGNKLLTFIIFIFSIIVILIYSCTINDFSYEQGSLFLLLITLLLGIVNKYKVKDIKNIFVDGFNDMASPIIAIAFISGISEVFKETMIDNYLIYNLFTIYRYSNALLYGIYNYIFNFIISFIVPNTGIIEETFKRFSVDVNLMTNISTNVLSIVISPFSLICMTSLAIEGINYSTWFRWIRKLILSLFIIFMMIIVLGYLTF